MILPDEIHFASSRLLILLLLQETSSSNMSRANTAVSEPSTQLTKAENDSVFTVLGNKRQVSHVEDKFHIIHTVRTYGSCAMLRLVDSVHS